MALADLAGQKDQSTPSGMTLSLKDTAWGYIVQEERDRFDRESAVEAAARFLGLILVICAYGQWLLPSAMFGADPLASKAVLSFFLGSTGAAIYWFASRGMHTEFHVDLTRRELRIHNRNSRGQTRLQKCVPMREVESAFLRRPPTRDMPAHLVLRLRAGRGQVQVATGEEEALTQLHKRLSQDLRPTREKLEDRLYRTQVPFTSRRAS